MNSGIPNRAWNVVPGKIARPLILATKEIASIFSFLSPFSAMRLDAVLDCADFHPKRDLIGSRTAEPRYSAGSHFQSRILFLSFLLFFFSSRRIADAALSGAFLRRDEVQVVSC